MTSEAFLRDLLAVLATEREAIRRLDSADIVRASQAKEELIAVVKGAEEAERGPMLKALALVRDELKRNLVLLAHARDLVREAALRESPHGTAGGRLSVQL